MKVFENKVIPAVAEKEVSLCTHAVCDICGKTKTLKEPSNCSGICDWAENFYAILETEIRLTKGTRSYKSYESVTLAAHVCPGCFENRLLPFIKIFKNEQDRVLFPTIEESKY